MRKNLKYLLAIIALVTLTIIAIASAHAEDCGWGTNCYNPPVGPQCHTVFIMGQGYTQVCQ